MSSGGKRKRRLRRKKSSFTKAVTEAVAQETEARSQVETELQEWKNTLEDKVRIRVEQELDRAASKESQRNQDLKATTRTLLSEMHHQASALEEAREDLEEALTDRDQMQRAILGLPDLQVRLERAEAAASEAEARVRSANARADKYQRDKASEVRRCRQRISSLQGQVQLLTAELAAERRSRSSRVTGDDIGDLFSSLFGAGTIGRGGRRGNGAPKLSKKDLLALIKLAHPDKHDGSEDAARITKALNAVRDSL